MFPGTGPVRRIHPRIRMQIYNIFLKYQKFFLNFCNLCIRLQEKARANQKGIGNCHIIPEIPYLCRVFLPRIAIHGILTAAPGSPGAVFYCPLCGFRALILAAKSGLFLHI